MTQRGRPLCGAPTLRGTPCRRPARPEGCGRHPPQRPDGGEADEPDERGPVRRQVDLALELVRVDWRTEAARALADAIDVEPQAAKIKELRSLMAVLAEAAPARPGVDGGTKEGLSVVDALAAKRAEKLAAAGGGAD